MLHVPANLPGSGPTSPAQSALVRRLEAGQILTGRVQRGGETAITIQFGMASLRFQVSQPLAAGLLVQVRSEGGQYLIESQAEGQRPLTSRGETATASTVPARPLLTTPSQAGLPGGALSGLMARILQLHDLPAAVQSLQLLHAALGALPAEQAPALALMFARNVPITPENLQQVRDRLRTRGNLGQELGKLLTEARAFLDRGLMRGSEHLAGVLVELSNLLTWNQEGTLDERVQRLKEFLTTLEEKLLGSQPGRARSDFRALLFELDSLLDQSEMSTNHPLRATLRKVLYLLEGAQLYNLAGSGTSEQGSWAFWRIPFPGSPQPTTIELAVRGEKDPENPHQFSKDNLELLIAVDLSVLGPVRAAITTRGQELSVKLELAEQASQALVETELPGLEETLTAAGFTSRLSAVWNPRAAGSLADELDPLTAMEGRLKDTPQAGVDISL